MKYNFELTLVVKSEEAISIDKVIDTNLSGLLGQFLVVIASIHRRIVNDLKTEMRVIDDDIPF